MSIYQPNKINHGIYEEGFNL